MLWSNPTPRHLAIALYQTLVLPWASNPLATVVIVCAGVGALLMLVPAGPPRRDETLGEPRPTSDWHALLLISAGFPPYLAVHLLFPPTDTIRFAPPILR